MTVLSKDGRQGIFIANNRPTMIRRKTTTDYSLLGKMLFRLRDSVAELKDLYQVANFEFVSGMYELGFEDELEEGVSELYEKKFGATFRELSEDVESLGNMLDSTELLVYLQEMDGNGARHT